MIPRLFNSSKSALLTTTPRRFLSIHEYLSMDVLKSYNVPIPKGFVASTPEEALSIVKTKFADNPKVVVKAQVLAGGRGKGHFKNGFQGGVHLADSAEKVQEIASKMLQQDLITKQTGAAGRVCNKVFIVEQMKPKKEYYFAILLDRKTRGPVLVGSNQGGMDIEAVAEKNPEAIKTLSLDIDSPLTVEAAEKFAQEMGFQGESTVKQAAKAMVQLYQLFLAKDATLVEINPLAEDVNGNVFCLDAKLNFDDNADFRQTDVFSLRDKSQEDKREIDASEFKLNYIGLDGNIGCLVNGAGLAMATMDIIKLHGGEPANFLDVGGGATAEQVAEAFRIISSDSRVKCIFVNIFGGIMRCDIIAKGIIQATSTLSLSIPIVVRLQGTNVTEAKELIKKSGMSIVSLDDMTEASKKAVALAKQ